MKTGFEELDNIIGSLNNGELTCIASRPGIGKTTLAIDIVNNVTNKTNDRILFISLENSKDFFENKIKNDKVEIITDKLFINEIENICRELYSTYKNISLIVFDYLQLIKNETNDNLNETIDIIKTLKQLSIDLNTHIIITSQLPRLNNEEPALEHLNIHGTSYYYHNVLLLHKDNENKIKIEVAKNIPNKFVVLEFNNKNLSFNEN